MAGRGECKPDKDTSLTTSIVGDSLIQKKDNPGQLHDAIQNLNKQNGPQQLVDLQKYLKSTCNSDIANQLLPKAEVGAKVIDFDTSKSASPLPANDMLDDPRNRLYNRDAQLLPEQTDLDKQTSAQDRFEHHNPRTNLQGSLAASKSGDAISQTLDKDAKFEKTGELTKDEQKMIFDRMDPARYQTALGSLEQSANKNLSTQQYSLDLHREFDKEGKGTEVINVVDSKTHTPAQTYKREQHPVDPNLHVGD